MNFAIGSAQFGFDYGVANINGQINELEGKKILDKARIYGVDTIDTASDYGQSESALGLLGVNDFRIITKLPARNEAMCKIDEWVRNSITSSITKLRISSLEGLLLHRSKLLSEINLKAFIDVIEHEKKNGRLSKFGVSIYDPKELDFVMNLMDIDIVQAPLNIFDRRLIESGWMQRLHDMHIDIHVRSVFLQGLLLLKLDEIPNKFNSWRIQFKRWQEWLSNNGLNPIQGCLASVNDSRINRVIVGIDNEVHLDQIFHEIINLQFTNIPSMSCNDLNLINPFNWSKI